MKIELMMFALSPFGAYAHLRRTSEIIEFGEEEKSEINREDIKIIKTHNKSCNSIVNGHLSTGIKFSDEDSQKIDECQSAMRARVETMQLDGFDEEFYLGELHDYAQFARNLNGFLNGESYAREYTVDNDSLFNTVKNKLSNLLGKAEDPEDR